MFFSPSRADCVVLGPTGAGKTRLLEEVRRRDGAAPPNGEALRFDARPWAGCIASSRRGARRQLGREG